MFREQGATKGVQGCQWSCWSCSHHTHCLPSLLFLRGKREGPEHGSSSLQANYHLGMFPRRKLNYFLVCWGEGGGGWRLGAKILRHRSCWWLPEAFRLGQVEQCEPAQESTQAGRKPWCCKSPHSTLAAREDFFSPLGYFLVLLAVSSFVQAGNSKGNLSICQNRYSSAGKKKKKR